MYRDLRQNFWWNNMKKEIIENVNKCLTCSKVKAEHKCFMGELRPLEISTWKWTQFQWTFLWVYPFMLQRRLAYG